MNSCQKTEVTSGATERKSCLAPLAAHFLFILGVVNEADKRNDITVKIRQVTLNELGTAYNQASNFYNVLTFVK